MKLRSLYKHSLLSEILAGAKPKLRFVHKEESVKTDKGLSLQLKVGPFGDNMVEPEDFDAESDDFRILAFVAGALIGYVDCYFESGRLYAYEVDVDKKFQRQGVATAMYDWAEELSGRTINSHKENGLDGAEISDDAEAFWKSRTKSDLDLIDDRFETPEGRQEFKDSLPFEGPWNGFGQQSPIEKVYPAISRVLADYIDHPAGEPMGDIAREKNPFQDKAAFANKGETYKATLYHGSVKPIEKFEVGKGDGRFGKGLYLIADKSYAEFYSRGGRQGEAGQKLKALGHVYEVKVQGRAFIVDDLMDLMDLVTNDISEADEAFNACGERDAAKVTKFCSEWAIDNGYDMIVFEEADAGVLTHLNQVLVVNQSAVKSVKPLKVSKK